MALVTAPVVLASIIVGGGLMVFDNIFLSAIGFLTMLAVPAIYLATYYGIRQLKKITAFTLTEIEGK